jgi:hypothetical protein
MNSHQQDTINEIKKLVEEENIEIEAALRLTLASQLIVTKDLEKIKTRAVLLEENLDEQMDEIIINLDKLRKCVNVQLNDTKQYLEKYPSVSWYWTNRRKTLILLILAIMVLYTVLFGPVNISDIRQAILSQLGLPPDLGIEPSGTPMP